MIPSDREVDRIISETGMGRMQAINHLRAVHTLKSQDERHHRSMRVRARVVDVSDETLFPEIAAACEWVRSRRTANDG